MSDDEVRSVSSTGGEKGTKLARYDLIPVGPLRQVAEHYGIGARKYEDRNWERGYEWSKSYAALQRHLNAFWGGEDIDEETQSPHLAAAVFHCLAMLEWIDTHSEFDDRATAEPAEDEPIDYVTIDVPPYLIARQVLQSLQRMRASGVRLGLS